MDNFIQQLDSVIELMVKLSLEWEHVQESSVDLLSKDYPLHIEFHELARQMIEWRDRLKNRRR
jgi:hypothetical protein